MVSKEKESVSPSKRVSTSFTQLSATAAELNAASDELGKSISVLDDALKKLNLGIPAWVNIQEWRDQSGESYTIHKIGYAKIGNKWGIALAKAEGNENYPEGGEYEEWLFNEAARSLRIEAVDKIPDLLAQLMKDAQAATKKVREKAAQARILAEALTSATEFQEFL